MNKEKDEQFHEILDLIDTGLATQNVPVNQRVLSASIEFLTKFVEQISVNGEVVDDFKSDFYDKKWFGSLYKQIEKWYCDKYGEAYNSYTKSIISGVVSIYNSPFKVIIPLTVDGKIEESGNKRWVTFPNSILDNEDVINWIENPPNLDQLNKEVLHEIYSKVSFVGESLRSIHINLMVFEKQKNSEIIGMASGIKQHLQNASNDILNSGNSGVMFAFWDLHLALEKAIKTLLMQKGSTTYYRHNLNSLFQEAVEEHGVDINYSSLSKLPTSKEAIQYRYGEIQGTTSEYAISIYNIVLSLVASTTKALERKITMNNASFQFQVPPWRK